ncbi:mechanosensitive ion channel family protein [Aquimarina aquimarini]|uniref:mechanosensitive ion channel family protein n=1 Tax=Aquimarina aquimarini TaxID=1191734 RepID=UPI000D55E512|nr:mechanosensitive ion channel family protein [Aquimarina aquimarini]
MTKFIKKYIDVEHIEGIILYVLVILLITWGISQVVKWLLVLFLNRKQKQGSYNVTKLKFVKNSIRFILFMIAFVIIMGTVPFLRRQATFIFSGAGILAAIIGFAAQAAISNLIAGVFIVLFEPFRIGDYIKLDSERVGIVIDITLRHTVINTFENKRLIIPNSLISTESILNHTIEDSKVLSFNNFKIGLNADIDVVRKIITEEALQLEFIAHIENKKSPEVRVIDVHESYIHVRAYVWISEPFQEFKMKCKLKERVQKRFLNEKIEMPIPLRRIINEE